MQHTPGKNDPRTFAIIGAGMEVYRVLGTGFLENVVRDALAVEFELRQIPFMTEVPFPVEYKTRRLRGYYRADFVCFESIIVEVKSTASKHPQLDQAQMLNYLKASGLQHGLLLNFAGPKLEFRRFVMSCAWLGGTTVPQDTTGDNSDDTM